MDLNSFLKQLSEESNGARRRLSEDFEDDWRDAWEANTICELGDFGDGEPEQTLLYWPTYRRDWNKYENTLAGVDDDDEIDNDSSGYIAGSGPWIITGTEDVGANLFPSLADALEAYSNAYLDKNDDASEINLIKKMIPLASKASGPKLISNKPKNLKALYNILLK